MIAGLILCLVASCAMAAPYSALHSGVGILGPAYAAPVVGAVHVGAPEHTLSYTATNVDGPTGAVKQQTAVGKDHLGGHVIRHSAQATNVDPHSGQSDVKTDEHEFHINPYIGQAAVHTSSAQGSLNPTVGKAVFAQKTHEAAIAPGHSSIAETADTAAVSPHGTAASQDVNAARTDVAHDGIAKNAHASHKSYVNINGAGGAAKAAETNHRSFDGPGYGNLHYDSQAADQAYDALGHASANEAGYKLDQAYDARVNLGASNEVSYSRNAGHDPFGNYASVTQSRQATQGGQLVPVVAEQPAVYISQPAVVKPAPVVYSEPSPVSYQKQVVYSEPAPVAYQKQVVYNEPAPVAYQKQFVYSEPAPVVSYQQHASLAYEPQVVYKQPVVYGGHGYYRHGY